MNSKYIGAISIGKKWFVEEKTTFRGLVLTDHTKYSDKICKKMKLHKCISHKVFGFTFKKMFTLNSAYLVKQ